MTSDALAGQGCLLEMPAPAGWSGRGFAAPGDGRTVPSGMLRFMGSSAAAPLAGLQLAEDATLYDATAAAQSAGVAPSDLDPPAAGGKRTRPNRIMALREAGAIAFFATYVPTDHPDPEVNGVLHVLPVGGRRGAQTHVGRFSLGALAGNMTLAIGLSPKIFETCI